MTKHIFLAPMAGYTDKAFRTLCMEYGATACITEMVSAKGLVQRNRTAWELLEIGEPEKPCSIQLFSDEPESIQRAIFALQEKKHVDWQYIDLNCGCPAKKIAGSGGGAALMKSPKLAAEICRAAVRESRAPVSVKFRLGWDNESRNAVEFAKRMEEAGAALLTVHGRTREQMYAPPVDLAGIAAVKAAVSIPVIANGDVIDGASALRTLEQTGCDGVMVGRGAFGRPWVFAQIANALIGKEPDGEPSAEERARVLLCHMHMLCANKGEKMGIRQGRSIAHHYFKGLRGASEFRIASVRMSNFAELEVLIDSFLSKNLAE